MIVALAEALAAAGQLDEAFSVIERAYTRLPTDADIQSARERLRQIKRKPPGR